LSGPRVAQGRGPDPVATLHIGEEHTVVTLRQGAESSPPLILPMGSKKTGRLFTRNPPSLAEMENAIMVVEDDLLAIRHAIPQESRLDTIDASIRAIAHVAGMPEQPEFTMTCEQVEHIFGRLAAIVQGRPVSQDAIPLTAEFSATLLILREFMHHLNFQTIGLRPARPPEAF
jgi:hypothetical protein